MKKRFQLIRMSLAEDGTPICPQRYRFKSEKVTMQWIQKVPKITIHYRNHYCEGCYLR